MAYFNVTRDIDWGSNNENPPIITNGRTSNGHALELIAINRGLEEREKSIILFPVRVFHSWLFNRYLSLYIYLNENLANHPNYPNSGLIKIKTSELNLCSSELNSVN